MPSKSLATRRDWSGLVFDYCFLMEDGSEIECRNTMREIVRWEDANDASFVEGTPKFRDLMWVGWARAKFAGLTTDDFPEFSARVADMSTAQYERAEVPTDAGLSPASPSN